MITQTTSPTTTIAAMITGVESPPPPPLCADAVELTDVGDVEPYVEPFVPPVGDDDDRV